jgi:hypothetical protein
MQFETVKMSQISGTNTRSAGGLTTGHNYTLKGKDGHRKQHSKVKRRGMPTHCTLSCLRHPCAKAAWRLCGSYNIVLYAAKQLAHTRK